MQTLPVGDDIGVVTIEEAIVSFLFVNIVFVDEYMMIVCLRNVSSLVYRNSMTSSSRSCLN